MLNLNDLQTTVLVVPKWTRPFDQSPITKDNIIVVSALATSYKVLLPIPEDKDFSFPEIPNVTLIPFPFCFPDFREEVFFTDKWFELFNTRRGKYCWDVIFNFKTMITDLFKKLACPHPGDFWDKMPYPSFSSPYCWVRTHQRFKEMKMGIGADPDLELLNVLQADGTFVRIEQERQYLLTELKRIVRPAIYNKIANKIYSVTCYEPMSEVMQYLKHPKPLKRSVLTAGRWSGSKGLEQCYELFKDAKKVFREVDFIINSQSKKNLDNFDCSSINIYVGQDYDSYLKRLADCAVFVCFSTVESFGHTVAEAIMLEKPVIFKRAKWHKNFISETYPYFADTNSDALLLLKKILNNYEDAKKHIKELKEYFLTEYSIQKAGESFSREIDKVISEQTGMFCKKLAGMETVKSFLDSDKDIVNACKEFNIPASVGRQLKRNVNRKLLNVKCI